MITEDDFEAWRDNEVTQAVFRTLSALGDRAKGNWLHASWNNGENSDLLLADLRAREEIIRDLVNIGFDELEDTGEPDNSSGQS